MNWRLFSAILACVLGVAVNAFLLYDEDIVGEERKKVDTRLGDPLVGMKFLRIEREGNLKRMGFEGAEVESILGLMKTMEKAFRFDDDARNVVLARINGTADLEPLHAALCGTGSTGMVGATLPTRYEALRFLVSEEEGVRSVVSLSEIQLFEFQDWAARARIDAVYESVEISKDRRPDATRMALGAILAGARGEDALLERRGGFGGVLFTGWSWDRVQSDFPGTRQRVEEYVALMHVVAEQAHRPGGLCRDEAAPGEQPPP